ncbi:MULTISPECIES: DUF3626 domain-containing protein [Paenibacillus]|uniref:DUF3626 domain-containing protein n=1 Tax=Paenibacillus odorifer TaxID=189426 RepID=A0A1R0WSK4_9BACL|nr:DUF3626 domain-containing protein [Paenibacillus odorifer]OMD20400.1 hypothetical protein BJP51_10000 [Paenibacillus odorifer]OME26715.1 hypothetical protein BSK57_07250 [Paenibacillus odorifer]OME37186.1 hypothetical protein BSK63_02500 [Paenibacillus odorifer]OME41125.1 hypothetical protein BSK46_05110 [Paenibacillus odorifer]
MEWKGDANANKIRESQFTEELSESQLSALEYVTNYARTRKSEAVQTIHEILQMSNVDREEFEDAVVKIKSQAKIALHFHPDRLDPVKKSVAEALLEQGVYKSQFETLLSSGSVSAYSGGPRDLWEERLFGGAYQQEGASNSERPKYGALDLMLHSDGPAPRFGSCYFLLSPEVSYRSTYTYMDSHQNPVQKGTYAEFDDMMAALLEEIFLRDSALGEKDLRSQKLVDHLRDNLTMPFSDSSKCEAKRNLNHYIEAQVHGNIRLKEDVEILVADPSFKGTPTGQVLEQICLQYAIQLYWHMGFAMWVDEVPSDFRGPTMPSLAKRIAHHGYIDTSMIGSAAMHLKHDPAAWRDRGTEKEVLQELKLLWHVLVRYGKPLRNFKL